MSTYHLRKSAIFAGRRHPPREANAKPKRLFQCLLAAFIAVLSMMRAEPSRAEVIEPFHQRIDGPVTVAMFQPLPNFFDKLIALDKDTKFIDTPSGWVSFWDSDVWIFFLKDHTEVYNLSEVEQKWANHSGPFLETTFSRRLDISLRNGRKVMYILFNLAAAGTTDMQAASCLMAVSAYRNIRGENNDFDVHAAMSECLGA